MNARLAHASLSALGGLVLAGCLAASDPVPAPAAQDKPAPAAPSQSAAGRYALDPVHSTVIFRVEHKGVSAFYGRFNAPTGSFVYDPEKPSSASFEVMVNAENVDTNNAGRDKHLKSQDFFNARQFPVITFKSTGVQRSSGKALRVTGDLTLHGITRPVTAELTHIGTSASKSGSLSGFDGRLTIKRSDFEMKFMIGEGVGDEVTLLFGLEGSTESRG